MRVVFRLLIAMLISLSAHAEDFTRSDAWGRTEAEARHNAFIKAIEFKVGVLMLSDRETKNYNQVKNDIYAYSDGFVTEYKTISVMPEGDGVRVVVDSKIATSKIKNRILIGGQSGQINGDLAAASYDTYKNTKQQADSLLRKVLHHYPKNAYDLKLRDSSVKSSSSRELELNVEFSVTLKPEFVKNLKETFDIIENPNAKQYANKVVIDNSETIRLFDHQNIYYIEDTLTRDVLYRYLVPSNARVSISLEDDNSVLYSTCRSVPAFVTINGVNTIIYAGQTGYYTVVLSSDEITKVMQNITKIQLSMINFEECKNE